jgi:hypothetical protein
MSPDSCVRILSAGAGLKVKTMSPDSLVRLATAAKEAGVQLEIKGSMSPDSMVRVASAGRGHVFFDISE